LTQICEIFTNRELILFEIHFKALPMQAQLHPLHAVSSLRSAAWSVAILLTSLSSIATAQINQGINQSVWKQKYGVLDAQMAQQAPYTNWLSEDADGDGVKNGNEFLAGTNPFKKLPNDPHFRPPDVAAAPTALALTFPTVSGKSYGAESNNGLVGPWVKGSLPTVVGDGTIKTLIVPQSAGRFFRVTVTDQSTSNDQVSDWAKASLGFSTASPISAQSSFNSATLAISLNQQNTVTLNALDLAATQPSDATSVPSDTGVIRISRSGFMSIGAITIPIVKSGTAVEGVDYLALPSSITFPAGVNLIDLKITPKFNAARTSNATLFIAANSPSASGENGSYQLGASSSAGVTIYPSGNATGTGLTAQYYPGGSSTYANLLNFGGASFGYTKATVASGNVVVNYTGTPAIPLSVGSQVSLQFSSGNMNVAPYNVAATYTIAAATASSFTVNTNATTIGTTPGNVTIGSFFAPVTRLDPTVDFTWGCGSIASNTLVNRDNASAIWEGYLAPTTAGDYNFQLDADDRARVLLDTGGGLTQILQNGWDDAAAGGFKQSANIPLNVPASETQRYRIRVEFVETTGNARCRIQWRRGTANFGNISSANVFTANTAGATTTGWSYQYFNNTTFTTPAAATGTVGGITDVNNGDWLVGAPDAAIPLNGFTARWTGQIMPQYSQRYFFVTRADDVARLWVNNVLLIDRWTGSANTDYTGEIDLLAGVRYDIRLEYFENTGNANVNLSWYSQDQAKQTIPMSRLFPTIIGQPVITSPTYVSTILGSGSPFNYTITGSNGGTFTAIGLPAWLTLTGSILSGTPPAAGNYQFTLTATNAQGSSSSVVTIEVLATGNALTRELWTSGVTGSSLSSVPWTAAPNITGTVTTAEDNATTYAANTGERLRGYFTAPRTGNYYFWVAASNVAELWISNDSNAVNKVRRSWVTGPTGSATRTWNTQSNQRSPWLSLNAGERYYMEALHNTGASGASNNFSIGWFFDSTGVSAPIPNGAGPAAADTGGVMPSYVLSPWDNPPTTTIPGTIYITNLQSAAGTTNITGSGGAFLRVNGSSAVLKLDYSGLTSGAVSRKIYNTNSNSVIFDIDAQDRNYPTLKTSDAGYTWNMSPADLTALGNGQVQLRVSTTNNPSGELTGTFARTLGSQTEPAVPNYPTWTSDHATNDASNSRFLNQATFGPSPSDMTYVKANGYRTWIEDQFTRPSTKLLPIVLANVNSNPTVPYTNNQVVNGWWRNSISAPDQLRQRAAFALSEILVTSQVGPLDNNGRIQADYYDDLLESCFANFRDLLKNITLNPAMGDYLDMQGNSAGNIITGQIPNENYAREILQLFSTGLYRIWPNGSLVLDSTGNAVPTYDQSVVIGYARVFTGWTWGQALQGSGRLPTNFGPSRNNYDPMMLVPSRHELGTKLLMDNVMIPAAVVRVASDTTTESPGLPLKITDTTNVTITNSYDLNGIKDLEAAFDNIMNNPAVGPYICRQLIQRLVTSNPKPEYLHRVVRAFNGEQNIDGVATGVKGDMKDVFRAILLDAEARTSTAAADPQFGKQREPLLRITAPARAFPPPSFTGCTYRSLGSRRMLITTPVAHRLGNSENVRLSDYVDAGGNSSRVPTIGSYATANTSPSYTLVGATGIATINSPGYQAGDVVSIQFVTQVLGTTAPFNTPQNYTVASATADNFTVNIGNTTFGNVTSGGTTYLPRNFTVDAGSIDSPSYSISGDLASGYQATVTASGYVAGHQVNLKFSTGSLAGGGFDNTYTIASVSASAPATFTVNLPSAPPGTTGGVVFIPKIITGYDVITSAPTSAILFYTSGNHNLSVGDQVQANFLVTNAGTPAQSGIYTVAEVIEPTIFKTNNTPTTISNGGQGSNGAIIYPLAFPPLVRNGNLNLSLNTWNVNDTNNELSQTPLAATSVFNFFYPDFQYPGEMAQLGMTTPEFQLSNASTTMNLTNGITSSILNPGNTNGYMNYRSGAIGMDLGPYMTSAQTSNAGIPSLVDAISTLLTSGNLTSATRTTIINYVANNTNFPMAATPTNTEMRNRVRAIVHLITTSAEFAIQR
jgi:uncharacterized protein (DUF1800 family)